MPLPTSRLFLAALAVMACTASAPAAAQSSAAMKTCADRWNDMKAKGQTGDLSFRQFSQDCMAGTAKPATDKPTTVEKPATTPSTAGTPKPAAAGGSMPECAARWNDMKARGQTGDLSFRQFSQDCMAGTAKPATVEKPAPSQPAAAPASKPRSSVPTAGRKPIDSAETSPAPARSESDEETGSDKAALDRCNAQWKSYKARHDLTGAKAWHVFMAKCLP